MDALDGCLESQFAAESREDESERSSSSSDSASNWSKYDSVKFVRRL